MAEIKLKRYEVLRNILIDSYGPGEHTKAFTKLLQCFRKYEKKAFTNGYRHYDETVERLKRADNKVISENIRLELYKAKRGRL